jgi:hypothetical protein
MIDPALDVDGVDELARLIESNPNWVASLTDVDLAAISAELDEDQWRAFVRLLENQDPWRRNPATMMVALESRYKLWRYTQLLGERFRAAVLGESIRQIWALPARYGKSLVASQWGPAWAFDFDPTIRLILTSYGDELAQENAFAVRDILRTHNLRATLRRDRQKLDRFMTTAGGGLLASGIRSTMAGFGADGAVVDDPHKDWVEAHSKASRDKIDNQVRSVVRMRLETEMSWMIVCHTRWHPDDLTGRLLGRMEDGTGEPWELVRLPAVAEEYDPDSLDPLLRVPDLLGRLPGQVLEPERFSVAAVAARTLSLGTYLAASLEQQRPSPTEGDVFKRAWWQLDVEDMFSGSADAWVSSWDMKLKGKKTGDYVVGQVWARTGKDLWLLDMFRGRWDQPTVENAVALLMVRWPKVSKHYMENTGNGPEVMEALRTSYPKYELSDDIASELGMTEDEAEAVQRLRRRGMPGIIPVNPKGDKVARAIARTGTIEAGDVHLPGRAAWLGQFLEEVSAFPNTTHDDIVDALTQAIGKLHRRGGRGMRTYGEELRNTRATSVG